MDIEKLRQKLMDEIYAGAAAGIPEMLADMDRIMRADDEALRKIAKQYGISVK